MTNREIAAFWIALNSREVIGLKGAKFAFAITKNKAAIKPTIEALETVQSKAIEIVKELEQARIMLCKVYAEKDENGNPIEIEDPTEGRRYAITDRRAEFDAALESLKAEHRQAIDERRQLDQEYSEL
ncbi:MAG: hypothetical protein ACYS76_16840, partial [Planctomycetota bacterium]